MGALGNAEGRVRTFGLSAVFALLLFPMACGGSGTGPAVGAEAGAPGPCQGAACSSSACGALVCNIRCTSGLAKDPRGCDVCACAPGPPGSPGMPCSEDADCTSVDGGGADGSLDDTGSFACGTTTCGAAQICVHPCCGGAAPSCLMDLPEASGCPNNLVAVSSCPGTGRPGCMAPPCTPSPPFCIDDINQCMNACACTSGACGECESPSSRDIMCRCG